MLEDACPFYARRKELAKRGPLSVIQEDAVVVSQKIFCWYPCPADLQIAARDAKLLAGQIGSMLSVATSALLFVKSVGIDQAVCCSGGKAVKHC